VNNNELTHGCKICNKLLINSTTNNDKLPGAGAYFIKLFTVDRVTFCHNVTDFWKLSSHKTMSKVLPWQWKSWHLQKSFLSRHGLGFIKCHGNAKTLQCHYFGHRRKHIRKVLKFRLFNRISTGFLALYDYLICFLHDFKILKWNMF